MLEVFNSITFVKSTYQQMSLLQNIDNFWYFFVIGHNMVLSQKIGSFSFLKHTDQIARKYLLLLMNSDNVVSFSI